MAKVNKRQAKKNQKKQAQKILKERQGKAVSTAKITQAEARDIIKKETARIKRNEQARARREAFNQAVEKSGIPREELKRQGITSQSALDKYIKQRKRREQRETLHKKKTKMLQANGFSKEEAEKLAKKMSIKDIKATHKNAKFTTREYLAILWFDASQESDLSTQLSIVSGWNKIEKRKRYQAVEKSKDRYRSSHYSGNFCGDYKMYVSADLASMEEAVKRKLRGDYEAIVLPTNQFSVDGIANLLATMTQILVPRRVADFYEDMQQFIRDNAPEYYHDIFY